MSIEEENVIDAIGIETCSNKVVLTISDHLDWSDVSDHLVKLQEKINTYLRFIEGGEIDASYPHAADRERVISVVFRMQPPAEAVSFLERAAEILVDAGIELRTGLLE
jgi:hypothetical protein